MKALPAVALCLALALGACADPYAEWSDSPPPSRLANALLPLPERVYRGIYSLGFESSNFTPSGSQESWWVSGESPANHAVMEAALAAEDRRLGHSSHATRQVFVVWRGRPSHRGRYGHMGASERAFHVTEVLSVRPVQVGDGDR